MKHFYLLFCLIFAGLINGQIIDFPDANFKAKLLQPNLNYMQWGIDFPSSIDINNDGEIEVSEIQDIYFLDISNANISDLTGISNFTDLTHLVCSNNLLTSLTIDSSISLTSLDASYNSLNSINVNFSSDNGGSIMLSHNDLTSFTVPNGFYESVNLGYNQLSSLTLDHASMEYFSVVNNNLSSFEVIGFASAYYSAFLNNNQFIHLDLSGFSGFDWEDSNLSLQGNDNLENITFGINAPAHIVYSSANSTLLNLNNYKAQADCMGSNAYLYIGNSANLDSIVFKNGFIHHEVTCDEEGGFPFQLSGLNLTISNCPGLSYLCVDEEEQQFFQSRINQLGLQNQVQVSSDCALGLNSIIQQQEFTITPVPVQNILKVSSKSNLELTEMEIYNNLGQIVQKKIGNRHEIDVSSLPRGAYYLKIRCGNETYSKQFLKG